MQRLVVPGQPQPQQQTPVIQVWLRWADGTPVVKDGQPLSLNVPVGGPIPTPADVLWMPGWGAELFVAGRVWDGWTAPGALLLVLVVEEAAHGDGPEGN